MKVYLLRHGHATHQIGHFQRIVNRGEFMELLDHWLDAELTEQGIREMQQVMVPEEIEEIYYSPLKRTRQSYEIIADNHNVLGTPEKRLIEVDTPPLWLPGWFRTSLFNWFYLSSFTSLFDLEAWRVFRETSQMLRELGKKRKNVLCISHKVRIISFVLSAWLHPGWSVRETNTDPGCYTILEKS